MIADRTKSALIACAESVQAVDWVRSFEIENGACLPIAVFASSFLVASGISSRVVECGARFTDPLSARYAEMKCIEPALAARNEKGLDFLGHCAVWMPTLRLVVDMSLPTQGTITIRNLGAPAILLGSMDHTKGQDGFRAKVGRGEAVYRIYPKRDGWSRRHWPFEMIKEMAAEARLGSGGFAFMG